MLGAAMMVAGSLEVNAECWSTASPDSRVAFVTEISPEGQLQYMVTLDGNTVINPSQLGMFKNGRDIGKGVRVIGTVHKSINDPYTLKAGKKLSTCDHCEETVYCLICPDYTRYDLIVRAYDDGVAFRYRLNDDTKKTDTIAAELTEFSVPVGGKAWIHPYDWNERHKPSYEQYSKNGVAVNSLPGHDRGWAFPMLFNSSDNKWLMITEAQLDGTYPATHVDNSGKGGCYRIRFPEADEPVIDDDPLPKSSRPWYTPWRVIMVGDDLNDIFTNQMVSHLNYPSLVEDTDWINPGRCAWSWWYNGGTARKYDAQIKYVDFCKDMGWEYSLIDAGWPGMDGEGVEGVVDYANKNGVGIWLWYHSGAGRDNDPNPKNRLMSDPKLRRAEMERISKMGVKGIKVDFFDTDKQRIVALYPQILKDAADNHLMVDLHGATLPRGFERTYPNLMTTEAIRGAETLGRQERCERAAEHNATIPFTRNVVGSMDYTPVTFSNKVRQGVPAIRRTSMAHQLALAVVFESGLQCFADRAEVYRELPDAPRHFLMEVPCAWDESRLLAGYPSDYAVIARRKGDTWYIGAISGKDEARTISFKLPEECRGRKFTLIKDGGDINSFDYEDMKASKGELTVNVAPNGGFAAVINK